MLFLLLFCCMLTCAVDRVSTVHQTNFCGFIPERGDIIRSYVSGGSNAQPNIYKWMALVEINGPFQAKCGGVVISDRAVLTAAHCLCYGNEQNHASDITVTLGINDLTKKGLALELKAVRIILHPDYNHLYETTGKLVNDLAILILEERISWEEFPSIRPICLPATGSSYQNSQAILTGWGFAKDTSASPSVLQEGNMTVYSDEYCRGKFQKWDSESMLCAGSTSGVDSCQGDSGGPLITRIQGNSQYELVGLVSWGIGDKCDGKNTESVYVNIKSFLPWIVKTTKKIEDEMSCVKGEFVHYPIKKTWFDARDHCLKLGGNLAIIRSVAENQIIADLPGNNLWIGASDRNREGTWVWVDNSTVDMANWALSGSAFSSQPDNYFNQDCALTNWMWPNRGRGLWDDEDCDYFREFVCQFYTK